MRRVSILIMTLVMVCNCCTKEYGARARVHLIRDPLLTPSMLHVVMSDGRAQWRFESEDFAEDPAFASAWSGPEVKTRTSGKLTIRFDFSDTLGRVVSQGEVVIPLRTDWRWSIDLFRTSEDPIRTCFGCVGSQAFAILDTAFAASDSDSVYVVWGGNYISNPVIY